MHLKYRNVNDAFRGLVRLFHEGHADGSGEAVAVRVPYSNPNGSGFTLRVDEPVTVTYTRPRERVLFNAARDVNPFALLYESLYMLAGRDDVAPLAYYSKQFAQYSDDGETLNGSYGHRWRSASGPIQTYLGKDGKVVGARRGGVDQITVLVNQLKAGPESRRAVLAMWNVEHDLLRAGPDRDDAVIKVASRDVCCNLNVMFRLRTLPGCPTCGGKWTEETAKRLDERPPSEGGVCPNCGGDPAKVYLPARVLDMTVTNRSNDLVWGMLGANYVTFSVLQEYMAGRLGSGVGVYNHFTNDLHVYDRHAGKLGEWLDEYDNRDKWFPQSGGRGNGLAFYNANLATVPLVRDPVLFDRELPEFVEAFSGPVPENRWPRPCGEPFLERVARPMFHAFYEGYKAPERRHGVAREWMNLVKADDWRAAGLAWLERRWNRKEATT